MPVCVLSARDEVDDRVRGLEAGADDYVVKPFALEEVAARLHALLRRRPAPGTTRRSRVGDLRARPARPRGATAATATSSLTRREFELLALFLRHPGEVLDRAAPARGGLGLHVRSRAPTSPTCSSATCAASSRPSGEPRVLHTVRGVGFVLRP